MLIGLSGYSGSGKDTVGKIIWDLDHNWEIKKFAGKLKLIASILTGIPVDMFEDQEFKKTNLSSDWDVKVIEKKWLPKGIDNEDIYKPMTVRTFLQLLGTDAMRNCLHDNIWVNALFADYKPPKMSEYHPSKWVITDVRFPNEAKAIKDKRGVVIRVDRPGCKPINDHPSETALDNWEFDFKIANVSDIQSLKLTVEEVLKQIKMK
jgi:hypothetical protein